MGSVTGSDMDLVITDVETLVSWDDLCDTLVVMNVAVELGTVDIVESPRGWDDTSVTVVKDAAALLVFEPDVTAVFSEAGVPDEVSTDVTAVTFASRSAGETTGTPFVLGVIFCSTIFPKHAEDIVKLNNVRITMIAAPQHLQYFLHIVLRFLLDRSSGA